MTLHPLKTQAVHNDEDEGQVRLCPTVYLSRDMERISWFLALFSMTASNP